MINRIFRIVTVAGVVALSTTAAFAQSELRAKVPFAFATPGGGQLPAGEYAFSKLNTSSPSVVYRISSVATGKGVIALAADTINRAATEDKWIPELTFRCAGDNCALSGIFPAGSSTGYGVKGKITPADPTTAIAEIRIPMGE